MDLLERLRSTAELTQTEQVLAEFVLSNPEEVTHLSSRELARRTFTSPTAVSRFCRKLGFANFNEFKVNVVSDLRRVDLQEAEVARGEAALSVSNKIASLEMRVVQETRRKVSMTTLRAIVDRLVACTYIDIVAQDANASIAHYASHNFTLARRICTVYENLDKMVFLSLVAPADHVVFLISKSGTDRSLLEVARALRQRHVTSVAMVADTGSPLARACDHVLEGFYYREFDKFGDIVFSGASKYLFDVLFVMLFSEDFEEVHSINRYYDQLYYGRLDRSAGLADRAPREPRNGPPA